MMSSCMYELAGVRVRSEVPLPGLAVTADGGAAVVTVRQAPLPCPGDGWRQTLLEGEGGPGRIVGWTAAAADGTWHRLRFEYHEHAADFVLAPAGETVNATWTPGVPEGHVGALLAGPVLGRALRLSGVPSLHGPTIVVDGRGYALLGRSGAGKSTLAAALVRAGCGLLADDMTACAEVEVGFLALRGQRRLRLWADTAAHLDFGEPGEQVLPGVVEMNKYAFTLPEGTPDPGDSVPLAGILVLGTRSRELEAPEFAGIGAAERLVALSSQVYGTVTVPPAVRARELAWLARLAVRVPIRSLRLPHAIALLDTSAARVLVQLRAGLS
jgi:hypothetical protein